MSKLHSVLAASVLCCLLLCPSKATSAENVDESFLGKYEQIACLLPENSAEDNFEGPTGKPFKRDVETLLYYRRPFAPAAGIPGPVNFVQDLEKANARPAKRLFVSIGDRHNRELYLDLFTRIAEREIDNTQRLIGLLRKDSNGLLLDQATELEEEYQRLLGPNIIEHLRMNENP